MKEAPAFSLYAEDFLTGVMYLTNEEKGIYITMLCKQWTDKRIPKKRLGLLVGLDWDNFSDELKSKFTEIGDFIVNNRLEEEREKKKNFLKKQRQNGKKGGRPIKKTKSIKNPNKTQNNPNEIEEEKGSKKKELLNIDYKKIKENFNSLKHNFPKILKINESRKTAIKARVKEFGIENIETVFSKAANSDFLNGGGPNGFIASFDWLLNPSNFQKTLEGNYDNKKSTATPTFDTNR